MTNQLRRAYYSPSAAKLYGSNFYRGSDGSEIEVTCVEESLDSTGIYGWPDATPVNPVTEWIRQGQAGRYSLSCLERKFSTQPLGLPNLIRPTTHPPVTPTIHLNGTSPQSLVSEYRALSAALKAASAALEAATCNRRDFPQRDDAWQRAREEREEAFAKLAEVQAYAEAWLYHASQA